MENEGEQKSCGELKKWNNGREVIRGEWKNGEVHGARIATRNKGRMRGRWALLFPIFH